jgi:hypothetical protein
MFCHSLIRLMLTKKLYRTDVSLSLAISSLLIGFDRSFLNALSERDASRVASLTVLTLIRTFRKPCWEAGIFMLPG